MAEYKTMTVQKFRKTTEGEYLSPVYVRDDGKYKIESKDRRVMGSLKRVYIVYNSEGEEITFFYRLKDAKTTFEIERR